MLVFLLRGERFSLTLYWFDNSGLVADITAKEKNFQVYIDDIDGGYWNGFQYNVWQLTKIDNEICLSGNCNYRFKFSFGKYRISHSVKKEN